MTQSGTLTIMGCASSFGVPMANGDWGACDPTNSKNRRTRCSALVRSGDVSVVIDTGPDFREQCLGQGVQKIDGIIYSHFHGDHANGIEDVRIFSDGRGRVAIPVLLNEETHDDLSIRYPYCFSDSGGGLYRAIVTPRIINEGDYYQPLEFCDLKLSLLPMDHLTCISVGVRLGDLAYCVDVCALSDDAVKSLVGVKTLIIDAAGGWSDRGGVHATIKDVAALNERIGAERVILTSLKPSADYEIVSQELKERGFDGFELAYDGLELNWSTFL